MNNDEFEAELYRAYDSRFEEVRHLDNLIRTERSVSRQDEFRKSLVLVLYAHFEGFCLFCLEHYQNAINSAKIQCREAAPAVVAGSWERIFNVMQHGDEKCEVFRKALPDDRGLHRHWRRRHFVEETERFLGLPVEIPDNAIDTESNLKPSVLQRNLFVLGLDHTFVEPHASELNKLLKRRNAIAHGDKQRGVAENEYKEFDAAVFEVCVALINFLVDANSSKEYQCRKPEYQV